MSDTPAAALRLEKKALDNGWHVEVEPRGDRIVTLGVERGRERVIGWWLDGKFAGAWQAWTPEPCPPACAIRYSDCDHGGVSPRRLSSRQMTQVITGE